MPKTAKWYTNAFVLVTVAESRDGDYQHPRVSVVQGRDPKTGEALVGLPLNPSEPTLHADTLITFEFQQNVGRNFKARADGGFDDAAPGWCAFREDGRCSAPYGGHLETRIELSYGRVAIDGVARRCADITKAIGKLEDARKALGVRGTDDDATTLILALKTGLKLPVLLVGYRVNGKPVVIPDPDLSAVELWRRAQAVDRLEARAARADAN